VCLYCAPAHAHGPWCTAIADTYRLRHLPCLECVTQQLRRHQVSADICVSVSLSVCVQPELNHMTNAGDPRMPGHDICISLRIMSKYIVLACTTYHESLVYSGVLKLASRVSPPSVTATLMRLPGGRLLSTKAVGLLAVKLRESPNVMDTSSADAPSAAPSACT
jgi:hypothetical protein